MEALSYFINSLRFPNRQDSIRMSLGIRSRSRKMAAFWRAHLDLSRSFINSNLEIATKDKNIREIVVLGAGALLDLDCKTLDSYPSSIRLVDVDPTVEKFSRGLFPKARAANQFAWQTADVTGVMDRWTTELKLFVKATPDIQDVCRFFRELSSEASPVKIGGDSCVISLNLMGQLGVYWRDRAFHILRPTTYYLDNKGDLLPQIDEALSSSVKRLEEAHVDLLQAARFIILITDIRYYYYRKDIAPWQVEDALTSFDLSMQLKDRGFIPVNFNSWLWHISPQGLGDPTYGEIHEVHALAFSRD